MFAPQLFISELLGRCWGLMQGGTRVLGGTCVLGIAQEDLARPLLAGLALCFDLFLH